MAVRVLQIAWTHYLFHGRQLALEESIYIVLALTLLLLLGIGKQLFYVAILSAIFIVKFDQVLLVGSIATPIFSFCCLFFAAHKKLVLDRDDAEDISLRKLDFLYFLLFSLYGAINLLSAIKHIQDVYWANGTAMELMLCNSGIGRFYSFFREMHQTQKEWFSPLMQVLTFGTLISQIVLIPMYLFKFTRKLLIIWFLVLLLVIFIPYKIVLLPHFTLLFFVLIFYRKSSSTAGIGMFNFRIIGKTFRNLFITVFSIMALLFAIKMPYLSKYTDQVFWFLREWDTKLWIEKKSALLGLIQPQVLNTEQLEGGQKWFNMYRKIIGKKELVCITGRKGERLNYYPDFLLFSNQGSDLIYKNYATYSTGTDTFSYLNSQTPYKEKGNAVTRLIYFDYHANGFHVPMEYEVEYYAIKHPTKNGIISWDFSDSLYETKIFLVK